MISPQYLNKISLAVADIFGWDIKEDRLDDLERGLMATAHELGIKETSGDLEKWLKNISWTTKEMDILTTHLTVGETYFFREKAWLDVFLNQIIQDLIRIRKGSDQSIRIWSAGCCSGEEPYSVAILLKEAIPDLKNWDISILGTDLNHIFLAKAEKGQYTSWSFRETSSLRKNRFFTKEGNSWQIDPEIKNMVSFAMFNLADDLYPSGSTRTQNMDVIFCRNVLMYFTPEQIRRVVRRFYQSLSEGGWLIVGAVELDNSYFSDFSPVRFGSFTVYQKPLVSLQPVAKPDLSAIVKPRPVFFVASKTGRQHAIISISHPPRASVMNNQEKTAAGPNAVNLFNEGRYERCSTVCESILLTDKDNIEILTFQVRSKANLGLLDEAMCWARKLAELPGVRADHFCLIANIFLEKNEIVSAEEVLKRALYLDPHHLMSHYLLATIANQPENKRIALKHLKNVKELLDQFEDESLVPGSDGMTVGGFRKILGKII